MKISLNYLNDKFALEFNEEILAASILAHLIQTLGISTPLKNHYGNQIALQLWSTNYCLDLKKSVGEQLRFINMDRDLNLQQTVSGDLEEFNALIQQALTSLEQKSIGITKVNNKYSKFRDELRKGPENYIANIKQGHLEPLIKAPYLEDNFQKLIADFDLDGLFTKNIIHSNYFLDDKSCDEDPLYAIADIAKLTFDTPSYEFFITLLFPHQQHAQRKAFTIDKNGQADMEAAEINKLYATGHPNYHIKLIHQGVEVEGDIEFLRYSLEKRLHLFNALLEKVGRTDRWFTLSNGSCLLISPEQYHAILDAHLLPPDIHYYNPWEY